MLCSLLNDRQTDGQTHTEVNTEDTLSGFQDFFLSTYHQGSVQYQSFLTAMAASFFYPIENVQVKRKKKHTKTKGLLFGLQ